MALLSSAWVLPSLLGPAVAGQVAEHASWRWVFVGILPPVLIGAGMLLPSLARLGTTETAPAERRAPRASGIDASSAPAGSRVLPALGLAAGVSLLLFAATLDLLLAAVALATVGLALALATLQRLLPRGTLSASAGLPAAVGMRGLLAGGFFGAEALIPLGLATDRGVPPSLVGLSLTAGALAWVAGSWVQDRAEAASAGAASQRALRAAGGLLLVLGGVGAAATVIVLPSIPLELVVAAWAAAGLGMGLAYPAATLTALGSAASGEEGAAAASLQIAETIGTAVGTGAAGALYGLASQLDRAASDGLTWGFALACVAIVCALVPALRLAPALRGNRRYVQARLS
jgi:MFS family permease